MTFCAGRWLFDEWRRSAHPASARRIRWGQGPELRSVAAVVAAVAPRPPPRPPPRPHQTGRLHQRPLRQLHDAPGSLRQISIKLAYHAVLQRCQFFIFNQSSPLLSSSSTLLLLLYVSIGGLIHLPSASVVNMFSPIRCLFLSSNLFKSLQIHLQKKKQNKKK